MVSNNNTFFANYTSIDRQTIEKQPSPNDLLPKIYDRYLNGQFGVIEAVFLLLILLNTFNNSQSLKTLKVKIDKTKLKNIASLIDKEDLKANERIRDALKELIILSKCDRLLVGLFHNGSQTGKIHHRLMSVYFEEVAHSGINALTEENKSFKDIEIGKITKEIEDGLESPGEFLKYARDETNLPKKCIKHLDSIGVEEGWNRLLITGEAQAYGIVQFQWLQKQQEDLLKDKDRAKELDKAFNKLVVLLEKQVISD